MRSLLEHYLLALRHEAHRAFPADRAEEIVSEIGTHIEDRVDSQVRDGIARPVAEADAVSDFGPVRKLVQRFLHAGYETPFARRARIIALCVVAVVAVILVTFNRTTTPDLVRNNLLLPLPAAIGIAALILGGIMGRRPQTVAYALVWCGAVLLVGLQVGSNVANLRDAIPGAKGEWWIPQTVHRNQIYRERQIAQKHLEKSQRELFLLHMGMAIFSDAKSKYVPAELKVGGQYLLPAEGTPGLRRPALGRKSYSTHTYHVPSPFPAKPRSIVITGEYAAVRERFERVHEQVWAAQAKAELQMAKDRRAALAQEAYGKLQEQFATISGEYAQLQWMQRGPGWLTAKQKAVEREKWLLQAYSSIEQSPSFNTEAVLRRVPLWFLPAMGWLALLLGTDFLAATVGRFLLRLRREWEWRITAARVR